MQSDIFGTTVLVPMVERALSSLGYELSIAHSYDVTSVLEKSEIPFFDLVETHFSHQKFKVASKMSFEVILSPRGGFLWSPTSFEPRY